MEEEFFVPYAFVARFRNHSTLWIVGSRFVHLFAVDVDPVKIALNFNEGHERKSRQGGHITQTLRRLRFSTARSSLLFQQYQGKVISRGTIESLIYIFKNFQHNYNLGILQGPLNSSHPKGFH